MNFYTKSTTINLFPQFTRILERHHPPWFQHQVITSGWIASLPLRFFLHTKFADAGNQNIIPGG